MSGQIEILFAARSPTLINIILIIGYLLYSYICSLSLKEINLQLINNSYITQFMKSKSIQLLSIFLLIFNFTLSAQLSFKPYSSYINGSFATALVISDINDDGLQDVAVVTSQPYANAEDYKLLIYYQGKSGNLEDPISYTYPVRIYSDGAVSLDAGDLNGDNKPDIAIASDDSLVIFYQQNPSSFKKECTYIGIGTDAVKIGDLNNDGRKDLALTVFNEKSMHIYYQDAQGKLNGVTYPAPECGMVKLEIVDINNDQLNDLILYSYGGYEHGVFYYLQNPNGTLAYPYSSGIGQFGSNGMAIGNLNNDLKPDIAITSGGNYPAKLELHMQQSNTFGFAAPQVLTAYDMPSLVCINDLNCDGKNEIITAHTGWHAISIFKQGAQNKYSTYTQFGNTYGRYSMNSMAIGDLNGDSRPDIALASGNLIIHYNDTKPAVSDSITTRKPRYTENFSREYILANQYVDTVNSNIILVTDSTNITCSINSNVGWVYHYAIREGFICNFHVNDTTLTDSIYTQWYDTISINRTAFYHHIDTISTTGFDEISFQSKIRIYPNPTSGLVYIDTKRLGNDASISLFNSSGTKLDEFAASSFSQYKIDLASKPKGLYFLKFFNDGKMNCIKIIHN